MPERPQGNVCMLHLIYDGESVVGANNHCYNLKEDFDDDGALIPGHNGVKSPITINELDKRVNMDPPTYSSIEGYVKKLKSRLKELLHQSKPADFKEKDLEKVPTVPSIEIFNQ